MTESAKRDISAAARAYAPGALSALISGFAAYLYVFTNKLVNLDEIAGLFSKGESVSSGRWALALTSLVFPDLSMPWFNGMLSLIMLTLAALLTLRIFEIKSGLLRLILPALIVVFPSQIVTFAYMFTCAPYALAALLAVASVYFAVCVGGRAGYAYSAAALCFSVAVYQAYLAISVSFYVVYLIKRTLDGEWSVKRIVKSGLEYVLTLILALALYFAINKLVMAATGTEYNSYAEASFQTDIPSLLFGLRVAFTAFFGYFYRGYYHLIATPLSKYLHYFCAAVTVFELARFCFKCGDKKRALIAAGLTLLLPFAVNCLYIVSSQRHTLMLYSFVTVYVLAAVTAESLARSRRALMRDALSVAMALIVVCNVYYANSLYLKMKLEYENAYEFYTTLVTRIKTTDGYEPGDMVYITGDADNLLYENTEIDTSDLVGVMEGLINIYSREDFITYYAGFDPPAFDWTKWDELGAADEIAAMPEYPYSGSVKKIGEFIVVKLG